MEEPTKPPAKAITGLVAAVLLITIATGAVVVITSNGKESSDDRQVATSTEAQVSSQTNFKDGTYEATGEYNSPGGEESVDVKVTLTDNEVTDISVVPHANVAEAAEYQSRFMSGYQEKVLGKKINEVSLSRVAGSSLTSIGFNRAIEKIRSEAAV